MNWVDILLGLVIGLSMLSGFRSGFARASVGMIAVVAGIFVGFWTYGIPANYLEDYVSSRPLANLFGFLIVFTAIVVLGALIGSLLARLFKWIGLSWFDRLLGGGFGFVRGIVVAAALVTVLLAFAPNPPPQSIVDSRSMPYIIDTSNALAAVTPHEIKDAFHETKEKVKKIWSEMKQKRDIRRVEA